MKERRAFLSTARTRTEFIQRVYDLESVTRSLPWDLLLSIEFETQKNWDGIGSMSKHPDWSSDWSSDRGLGLALWECRRTMKELDSLTVNEISESVIFHRCAV